MFSFYLGITDLRFVVVADVFTVFCGYALIGVVLFITAFEGVRLTYFAGLFELILES